jgi:hypothetical protein
MYDCSVGWREMNRKLSLTRYAHGQVQRRVSLGIDGKAVRIGRQRELGIACVVGHRSETCCGYAGVRNRNVIDIQNANAYRKHSLITCRRPRVCSASPDDEGITDQEDQHANNGKFAHGLLSRFELTEAGECGTRHLRPRCVQDFGFPKVPLRRGEVALC